MPLGSNGMTYVDMVFPAFLFVMGVSIPLAVERRVSAGDSYGRVWLHNVGRSLSLVVLGLFIANAPQVDRQHAGIGPVWWAILGFAGIALFWGVHHSRSVHKRLDRVMKYAGILILAGLFVAFRRITPGGQVAWLDFSDWEILGLLGWAYLFVSSLYLLLKKSLVALTASLVFLSALNAVSILGWLGWLRRLPPYAQPFEAGLSSTPRRPPFRTRERTRRPRRARGRGWRCRPRRPRCACRSAVPSSTAGTHWRTGRRRMPFPR